MKKIVLSSLVLFLSHGSALFAAEYSLKKFRWHAEKWTPISLITKTSPKNSIKKNELDAPSVKIGILAPKDDFLKSDAEIITRSSQLVNGVKISNTWVQTIYSKTGSAIYSTGEVLNELPVALSSDIQKMTNAGSHPLDQLKLLAPQVNTASFIYPTRVEVMWIDSLKAFKPVWIIVFQAEKEDAVYEARISQEGHLLSLNDIGAHVDGKALVFPNGPKNSSLGEVILHGLFGDGSLSGTKISISSALNIAVNAPNLFFDFKDEDRKFDQVHVYFFIDKALKWFSDTLGVETKQPLNVRVHIGTNGVSNAAFYHNNGIYLGTGDGVTYQNMLRDPSIVIHEAVHAIIDTYAGLPTDGEGGSFNEGFADLFAALMLDNPNVGESAYLKAAYRRTLNNSLKAYENFTSGVYNNGTIIGATFWDIKKLIGNDRTAKIAFKTLVRLGAGAKFNDFVPALISAISGQLSDQEYRSVVDILAQRGWRLADVP